MPFIGNKPSAVPLTSADITDNIIVNADINTSAGITTGKLNLISTASVASVTAKGTPSVSDGYIQLNCEQNSHGIKIKSPPHSAGANYTLVMPSATGTSEQVLRMNTGATALEFASASSDFVLLATSTISSNVASLSIDGYFSSTYTSYKIIFYGVFGSVVGENLNLRFNRSGSAITSSNYINVGTSSYFSVPSTQLDTIAALESKMSIGNYYSSVDRSSSGFLEINNPLSTTAYKTVISFSGAYYYQSPNFDTRNYFVSSTLKDSTSALSGITFLGGSGTLNGGTFKIYGIK